MSKNKTKKNKFNKGFTPTPILALLQSSFSNFLKRKNYLNKSKVCNNSDLQQKTMPNLVLGFTLIEMIVAIALFSTVMVVGMGSLLNVLAASKKSQDIQTAVNNLSLAMETMSREIRTGYNYRCPDNQGIGQTEPMDCPSSEERIIFEAFDGKSDINDDQIVFELINNQIKKSSDFGNNFLSMTSPELYVEGLDFVVVGSDINDFFQPKVLITTYGYVGDEDTVEKDKVFFNLQTTVSQRRIDTGN